MCTLGVGRDTVTTDTPSQVAAPFLPDPSRSVRTHPEARVHGRVHLLLVKLSVPSQGQTSHFRSPQGVDTELLPALDFTAGKAAASTTHKALVDTLSPLWGQGCGGWTVTWGAWSLLQDLPSGMLFLPCILSSF